MYVSSIPIYVDSLTNAKSFQLAPTHVPRIKCRCQEKFKNGSTCTSMIKEAKMQAIKGSLLGPQHISKKAPWANTCG